MITLLIFITVLAVLVLSHEFGHFIVARANGIKVDEFGFGFPPRVLGVRRLKGPTGKKKWQVVWGNKAIAALEQKADHEPGTLYSFNLLPLGGFVKIKGENGDTANEPDSFVSKKAWQKSSVLVAGVVMNIIVAWVLVSVGLLVGFPQSLDGIKDVSGIQDRRLEVMEILPGKPAEAAGLKAGDSIIALANSALPRLPAFQDYVNGHRDQPISLTIERGNQTFIKTMTPAIYADTGKAGFGIAIAEVGTIRYPWYQAFYQGAIATAQYFKAIVSSFYDLIKGLFHGSGLGDSVSGPVGVAVMTGQVARLGFIYLLQFMALLSLNLAVLNILPIPALDGGRLLFVIIGALKGRPVTPKYEQIAHTVGFALLMVLVVAITIKDLGAFKGIFLGLWNKFF